jgi:prepilin-type N-terminal cleavage/methylation domain-containing protein
MIMLWRNHSSRLFGRRAYTLLEVLLASAIGVMLMAALYVAMDVQLRNAQAGRDIVGQSGLARAVMSRIAEDIVPSMGPFLPTSGSSSPSSSSAGGGGGGGGGSAMGGSSSAGGGAGGGAAATPSTSTTTRSPNAMSAYTTSTGSINLGVQGDQNVLTLTITRLPREVMAGVNDASYQNQAVVNDQRRITYWLAGGGLARQEIKSVFSSDAMSNLPPNIPDDPSLIIAEEVRSLSFSYWNGSVWADTWDGTQLGADGVTPQGPPLSIAITMTIAPPGSSADDNNNVKTYRHEVVILTANGIAPPNVAASGSGSQSTTGQ